MTKSNNLQTFSRIWEVLEGYTWLMIVTMKEYITAMGVSVWSSALNDGQQAEILLNDICLHYLKNYPLLRILCLHEIN